MYFKSVCLALGALTLAGFTAGAEEAFDACNVEIEGATVLMSRDEVAAEWSSRGYVRKNMPRHTAAMGRSGGRAVRGVGPATANVLFHTGDNKPSSEFVIDLTRQEISHPDIQNGAIRHSLLTIYVSPDDPVQLAQHRQFVIETVTAWCAWSASRVEGQDPRLVHIATNICDTFRASDFATNSDGISFYVRRFSQGRNRCNWVVTVDSPSGNMQVKVDTPRNVTE
jgi:hypothetical protein